MSRGMLKARASFEGMLYELTTVDKGEVFIVDMSGNSQSPGQRK